MNREFHCHSEAETEAAGREIAHLLPAEGVFHLIGDLGAGKTFLIRAIVTELGADPLEVASPTFAIVHEYDRPQGPPIVHIDGYRLSEKPREWMEIGIPELLQSPGLKFIEWPKEPFRHFAPRTGEIEIQVNEDDSRTVRVRMNGKA
jgi:tRNA threonylcarbamoyladenosine biosynthesis protein TsaE